MHDINHVELVDEGWRYFKCRKRNTTGLELALLMVILLRELKNDRKISQQSDCLNVDFAQLFKRFNMLLSLGFILFGSLFYYQWDPGRNSMAATGL